MRQGETLEELKENLKDVHVVSPAGTAFRASRESPS